MKLNRNSSNLDCHRLNGISIVHPETGHVIINSRKRDAVIAMYDSLALEAKGYRMMTSVRLDSPPSDLEYTYLIEPKPELVRGVSNKHRLTQYPIY